MRELFVVEDSGHKVSVPFDEATRIAAGLRVVADGADELFPLDELTALADKHRSVIVRLICHNPSQFARLFTFALFGLGSGAVVRGSSCSLEYFQWLSGRMGDAGPLTWPDCDSTALTFFAETSTPLGKVRREDVVRVTVSLEDLSASIEYVAFAFRVLGAGPPDRYLRSENQTATEDTATAVDVAEALTIAETFKQNVWRASDHLGADTESVENVLIPHLKDPAGDQVVSHGCGEVRLRRPDPQTFRQVISLVSDRTPPLVRKNAIHALALYGQAFKAEPLPDAFREDFEILAREAVPKLRVLLDDSEPEIRGAAALGLGHLATCDFAATELAPAFKREEDGSAKLQMAWAIQRLFCPLLAVFW